jgi:hypothetical protein
LIRPADNMARQLPILATCPEFPHQRTIIVAKCC